MSGAVVWPWVEIEGGVVCGYHFWCLGCESLHGFGVKPGQWTFDGNVEKPTVSPSLLMDKDRPERRCHLFIRNGQLQYLGDCHHALAGQTVDMTTENKP